MRSAERAPPLPHAANPALAAQLSKGYEVVVADRVAPDEQSRTYGNGPGPKYRAAAVEFKQVDVTDLGQVASVTADADAIVHMAAYPFPGPVTEDIVFRTNVMNNWNVLEAAEMNGIRKVVMASSINALGEQPDRLFAMLKYRHVLNINQWILPRQTQYTRRKRRSCFLCCCWRNRGLLR
jgi:nucleoside-diphosphate-sugar epimerase